MASIKAKIMCGTYTLQHDRAKFDRSGGTNSACKLCGKGSEDIKHFLLYCEKLRDIQEHFLNIILVKLYDCVDMEVYNEILSSEDLQLKVIIDCSSFEFLDESNISNIECVSRGAVNDTNFCANCDIPPDNPIHIFTAPVNADIGCFIPEQCYSTDPDDVKCTWKEKPLKKCKKCLRF
ncbi:Hypothetical predicted protein [Mytilus galloprovincialis]|uniref:Reverse transcriptase zinc-binding domain-containing protein n=1 Tax=Mytilus galloprovincialis TaxID=29158 RepID=A0A8B6DC90_MYTGA|nr:Hypothetical predicted protein [Mytilus galloprovincialis]